MEPILGHAAESDTDGLRVDARGWYLRARVAEEYGDLEEAERSFQWMLRLDRDGTWSLWHWAEFLGRQSQYADAVVVLEQVLSLDASFAPAHRSLGLIYAAARDDAAAIHHLELALESSPEHRPWEVLSRVYQRTGDLQSLGDLVRRWALEKQLDLDARLARAQAALAARQSAVVFDELLDDARVVRSPLWINLAVQSSGDACRLWDVGQVLGEIGASEDLQLRSAWQSWQLLAGDPGAEPTQVRTLAPLVLRLLEQGRPRESLAVLATYSRVHGASQPVALLQALALSHLGEPTEALARLNGIDEVHVLPVMDRRFTEELRAPLVDQARALRSHLQLALDRVDQDPFPALGVDDRRAVRTGQPPRESLSPRVRTALLIDSGRLQEARVAASTPAARRLLPGPLGSQRMADDPGCNPLELMARAEQASPCEAAEWLLRARNAGPFVPGIKDALATASDACDTLVPSEVP